MKKISRRYLLSGCVIVILAALLCILGDRKDKKIEIEVALWNLDVYSNYTERVQALVPDVKILWVKGDRSLDYYKQLAEDDNLPDIITARKFSLKDSLSLNPYLFDLTKTEVASSYYDVYLENYETGEGEVFWVPMAGTVDGIVANKMLFEEYGISVPKDFDGFISACVEFEKHGIRGYSLDFKVDYNALHFLQGMGIENLSSLDGIVWRKEFEGGEIKQLDPHVWMPAFEKIEKLNRMYLQNLDTMYFEDLISQEKFAQGTQAMVNVSSESISKLFPGMDLEILPYFGEKQNFLLTYPSFNAAISKGVGKNSKKKEAAWKVLKAMTSPQAQEILNQYTDGLVSYQRDVSLECGEGMETVQQYLETNRTYIRLGSEEFFKVSRDTIVEMLENNLSARSAFDLMNDYLSGFE